MYFHGYNNALFTLTLGFLLLIVLFSCWCRDIIREGTYLRYHTREVLTGLRLGFILFILSEVMFFFPFSGRISIVV